MRVYDLNRYNYQGKSNIWMRLDINGYDEIKTHILYYKVRNGGFERIEMLFIRYNKYIRMILIKNQETTY